MESVNANSLTFRFWCLSLLKSLKENNRSVYRMYHKRLLTQSHKKITFVVLKNSYCLRVYSQYRSKKRDEHSVSRGECLVTGRRCKIISGWLVVIQRNDGFWEQDVYLGLYYI